MKKYLPLGFLLLGLVIVLVGLRPVPDWHGFALGQFGRLPTLVNGRIKPMDTVARTSLLILQGRQRVARPDGTTATPTAWLLDMLYQPERANDYQVFEVVHPDVLATVQLTTSEGAGGKRFSYRQLAPQLVAIDRQARLVDNVEHAVRTPFQRAISRLRDNLVLYQRLQHSFVDPGDPRFLERLRQLDGSVSQVPGLLTAGTAGARDGLPREVDQLGRAFTTLETFGYLLPVPGAADPADPKGWRSAGAAWKDVFTQGRANPVLGGYVGLGLAWRSNDPAAFNRVLDQHYGALAADLPDAMRKTTVEAAFNRAQPFSASATVYVVSFLLAVFSWLRWPELLGRAAFHLLLVAFVASTVGIGVRMWLEGRPPVTNLYSSALFVGWGGVALCVFLEKHYRNAVGSVAAGVLGFSSLLIAHHLSLGGDTLEMMRAVLDSNFWLATHVVTIALGYSAMFLAGFLALIYVVRGVLTKSLDQATAAALVRMVYGVVCFATFFSFIGTVLGGIWADQSWGRFWGWDPKENGALIIVIWCALILHARWGGLVKARGLMNLAIFGNIVTAWSWFGVNMLGVGLHSYGFMDSAFWWLLIFGASQLTVMALAAVPLTRWRSRAAAAI